jgi:hypothetical protein
MGLRERVKETPRSIAVAQWANNRLSGLETSTRPGAGSINGEQQLHRGPPRWPGGALSNAFPLQHGNSTPQAGNPDFIGKQPWQQGTLVREAEY